MRLFVLSALSLVFGCSAATPPPAPAATPELFFLLMNQQMNATYDLEAVDQLFDRAEAAGYDGVVLYDTNLEALGSPYLRTDYVPSLQRVIASAQEHKLAVIPQAEPRWEILAR